MNLSGSNGNSNVIAMVPRRLSRLHQPHWLSLRLRTLPRFTGHDKPGILDELASSTSRRHTIQSVSTEPEYGRRTRVH